MFPLPFSANWRAALGPGLLAALLLASPTRAQQAPATMTVRIDATLTPK